MLKNIVRTFAFAAAVAAVSAVTAEAAPRVTRVTIPFEFRVNESTLPPGDYVVREEFGKQYVTLTNKSTGERAFAMRTASLREDGRTRITFTQSKDGVRIGVY